MRPSRMLVRVALVLVGAAALASVSFAATRPDDRAGTLGVGAQPLSAAAAHPDNRVGIRGVTEEPLTPAAAHPDNRPGIRGVPVVVAPTATGTDWRTIGIGIGAGVAAILLVVAGVLTTRHGGHRPHRPIPTH